MIRDVKTDLLFTINELSKDEQEEYIRNQAIEQGKVSFTKDQEEDMKLFLDQHRETAQIPYPSNLGITGIVFNSHKTYIGNEIKKETSFVGDIDNQTNVSEVINFMIGPCFGHIRDSVTREQADLKFNGTIPKDKDDDPKHPKTKHIDIDRSKPIGIVQFINKQGTTIISEYDRKKFEAI